MLSHKMDFSFCAWKPGFVKSSHNFIFMVYRVCRRASGSPCSKTNRISDMHLYNVLNFI